MDSDLFDNLVKFNSLASGRDKLFRLLQYGSKFTWWYLHKYGANPEVVDRLQKLGNALSTTRKFMQLGKSLDFIHGAIRSLHLTDSVLRWTITLAKINQSVSLLFDHIIWAGRIGLTHIDKDKWSNLSARFWIVTLTLNLVRDIYDIYLIISQELRLRIAKSSRSHYKNGVTEHRNITRPSMTNTKLLQKCLYENQPVFLDLVKNLSDLILPLEALGYARVSPGIQGLAGTVSSLIGVMTAWNPLLKLVPS